MLKSIKQLFDYQIVKRNLLDRYDNVIDGDINEEFNKLPSKYIRTCNCGNDEYHYYIIQNTNRINLFNWLNISLFDKITYTIITHLDNSANVKFNTDKLICIGAQINFHLIVLYDKIY